MSVASEITRLQNAKSALKTSIENKGVTVSDSTLLSGYSALVDQIQTGGGQAEEVLIDLIERDITSITIPSGTTRIGNMAFRACLDLTTVTIPDSVTEIASNAFNTCSGLTSITIPNSVTAISNGVFANCSRLTSVTINATTPPTLGTDVFKSTNSNLVIYVPTESVDAYKAATNWSSLADRIQPISE